MEIKLKIGYAEIWELVNQMPASQLLKLKGDLEQKVNSEIVVKKGSGIQDLLLGGPTMDDEDYEEFLKNRKEFGSWRKK